MSEQDDIAKLKKDYVTFTFKNNKGKDESSVYLNNTPDNLAIAKELLALSTSTTLNSISSNILYGSYKVFLPGF